MKRRLLNGLLTLSLLVTTLSPAGVAASETTPKLLPQSEVHADTKDWVIQQSSQDQEARNQGKKGQLDLTEQQIADMHWDQLTTKEVLQIYKQFDRKSLQIASYFYSNLNKLLTEDEFNEMLQWDDEDVLQQMEALKPSQIQLLTKHIPLIPNTHKKWKKEKEERDKKKKETSPTLAPKEAQSITTNAVTADNPSTTTTKNLDGNLRYKEIDRPYLYARQNTTDPVSDQFRDANIVENDLVLEGPRDMDLVITRRYNSSQAKPKELGYYESKTSPGTFYNDTRKRRFANEWIPFSVGWTLNLPYFEYTDNVISIDPNGSSFRQYPTHHERWVITLDDGTSLTYENGSFKDYPYPGELSFQLVDYNKYHFRVGKGGYVYEFRTYNDGLSLEVTKTNPYGDRIQYNMHKDGSDITIKDALNRYIVLDNSTSYGIESLAVYENSSSTYSPSKMVRYVTENVGGTLYAPDYLKLTSVRDGVSGKNLSEYSYSIFERLAEFNYKVTYNKTAVTDFEDSMYTYEDQRDMYTTDFVLLSNVKYPQEGYTMKYYYTFYDNSKRMDQRGLVRLYQDDHALSYMSYHPVTDVYITYTPYGEESETNIIRRYLLSDETGRRFWEVWKKPKSVNARLSYTTQRFGDEIFSYETVPSIYANTPDVTTHLKKFRVNTQGNNRLQYVRSQNKKNGTLTASNGTENFTYNPISYVSYAYDGNNTEPTYEFSFLELPATAAATFNYLKNPTVVDYTDAVKNYAVVTKSTYNSLGDIIEEIDAKGNTTQYLYKKWSDSLTEFRKVSSITKTSKDTTRKHIETFVYDDISKLLLSETTTDTYPNQIGYDKVEKTYVYPADRRVPTQVTETFYGNTNKTLVKNFTYDSKDMYVTSEAFTTDLGDGLGTTLRVNYQYDMLGRLLSQSYPDGSNITYKYDSLNRVTDETFSSQGLTRLVRYTYDETTRKVTKHFPDNSRIETYYNPFGKIELKQEIANNQTRTLEKNTYTIDGTNLETSIPFGMDNLKTQYFYNPDGSLSSEVNGVGHWTNYTYANAAEKMSGGTYLPKSATRVQNPRGLDTLEIKDQTGLVTDLVEKTGDTTQQRTTLFTYNDFGHQTGKTVSNKANIARSWTYNYDNEGNLLSIRDPELNQYQFEYDSDGNLEAVVENSKRTTEYTYNNLSWKLTETNPLTRTVESFVYTPTGEVRQYKDKSQNTYEYTYTPLYEEDVTSIKDTSGVTVYTEDKDYDPLSRDLISERNNNHTITYEYDPFNRRTAQTVFSRKYQIGYTDADDRIDTFTYPNGPTVSYRYDNLGRMTQLSSTALGTTPVEYTYTTTPQDETVAIKYPNNTGITKLYNSFGEMKELSHTQGTTSVWKETNTYDGFGNLSQQTCNAETRTYRYDKIDRIIDEKTPKETRTYTYDTRGNRQGMTTNAVLDESAATYTYDKLNRLATSTMEGITSSYTYYPGELRATKTTGTNTTKYVYLDDKVIEELDASNQVKARNFWGEELVFRQDMSGTVTKEGFYYPNSHGDIVYVKDKSGVTLNEYQYDVWGNITSQRESMSNPFKYSGEFYDPETKLYYLKARYYDPNVGRFITEDTYKGQVSNPHSLNLYTYGWNNPLKYNDPDGHNPALIFLIGVIVRVAAPVVVKQVTKNAGKITKMLANNSSKSGTKKTINGGKFGDVDKVKGPNEVGHHIPQNAYNKTQGVSRNNGPAVKMTKVDHAQTRTFAGKGKKTMKEDAGLNARQRLAKDVWDVKDLYGKKYNEGLKEAVQYGKKLYPKK
ncbi:RHS repeat domain-containing protein [Brevibacillus dissolubilis]|uniref:RHS repeat domain-containing protein n=1 Tax=Brevibacillus dissolubilis TaxID=1844116 RepID=UPI00111713E9|nr:RHS repeat-associated core domain-containing protein [Brevibacillus dissolubilis]